MVEFKKLKRILDRSKEEDGLQEEDSEFMEFPRRRKQNVTLVVTWVAGPEQTFGVGNGCHLSKAKEAVELFKTSHSFLSTNEPLL